MSLDNGNKIYNITPTAPKMETEDDFNMIYTGSRMNNIYKDNKKVLNYINAYYCPNPNGMCNKPFVIGKAVLPNEY